VEFSSSLVGTKVSLTILKGIAAGGKDDVKVGNCSIIIGGSGGSSDRINGRIDKGFVVRRFILVLRGGGGGSGFSRCAECLWWVFGRDQMHFSLVQQDNVGIPKNAEDDNKHPVEDGRHGVARSPGLHDGQCVLAGVAFCLVCLLVFVQAVGRAGPTRKCKVP
jgi:hypothetical protein